LTAAVFQMDSEMWSDISQSLREKTPDMCKIKWKQLSEATAAGRVIATTDTDGWSPMQVCACAI